MMQVSNFFSKIQNLRIVQFLTKIIAQNYIY